MILFVNGPFGVGKTSVANLLVRRLPRTMLYDPEIIGGVFRRVLGTLTKVEDYQDYTVWRRLVVGGAGLLRSVSSRTLIIPMTIWKRDVFDFVIDGLCRVDPDVFRFRLTAPKDVLVHRISSDSDDMGAYSWRISHLEVSWKASRDPAFGQEIATEGLTPTGVADQIMRSLRERRIGRE